MGNTSTLHPRHNFDLVIFFQVDQDSRITITFDGNVVFAGDLSDLLTLLLTHSLFQKG